MRFRDLFSHVKSISADDAKELLENQPPGSHTLLDVREPNEYEGGHIPGARFIPLSELPDRLNDLDPTKPVITY